MKNLVVYFSISGRTAKRAQQLADCIGADIFQIKAENPYTGTDLNWHNKDSRVTLEMEDKTSRPAIVSVPNTTPYDRIYIGYPIWWGVAPRVVNTLIESVNLENKEIVLFATSGGSEIDHAIDDMRNTYPNLLFVSGKMLNEDVTSDIY